MIATVQPNLLRRRPMEHRTEPRIVTLMEPNEAGNTKLKPTVFLPNAVMRQAEIQLSQ
jgi:hypothetical protein